MAIAIHPSTPARVTDDDTVSSITTAPFSPPAQSLLLAFIGVDSTTGGAVPSFTIQNSGTALSWIAGPKRDANDPQDYPAATKVWAAAVPTARTNMTVTVNQDLNNEMSLKVYVLTGAHLTSPFGFQTSGSTQINHFTTPSITIQYANSLGFISAIEGTPLSGAPTAPTLTWDSVYVSSQLTGGTGYKTLGAAGTTTTFSVDGAGSSGANWNWIAVEIRAGSVSLTPTGIPSAQAFGTPDLDVGSVNVLPGGIPPGVVGTPRVQRALRPTGIPSAEAFGAAAMGGGFNAVGIKSAEVFGDHVIHNYGLGPTGIPSAEGFGNPTIQRGPVTIELGGGISSAEAFGEPKLNLRIKLQGYGIPSELIFGAARVRIPQIVTRQIPQRVLTRYELTVVSVVPNTTGPPTFIEIDPIKWTGLKYSDQINKAQSLTASANISNLTEIIIQRIQNLDDQPTELWLTRNGVKVFAGPLLGGRVSGEEISFEAQGLLSYLKGMYVMSDLTFTAQDQFNIVKGLVDHYQSRSYGNWGIGTTNIGVSGVNRDITYRAKENNLISKKIEELSVGANGFDFDIDPSTRMLNLYYPRQGVDRSQGEDAIVFDKRNVTSPDISFSVVPTDVATEAIGSSSNTTGENLISIKTNDELMAKRGRIAVGSTFDAADQTTLDSQTQGLLNARSGVLLVPGGNTRVTDEVDISKYDVGDTVAYELHRRLAIRGSFRLLRRDVTVSNTGTESADFQFA